MDASPPLERDLVHLGFEIQPARQLYAIPKDYLLPKKGVNPLLTKNGEQRLSPVLA